MKVCKGKLLTVLFAILMGSFCFTAINFTNTYDSTYANVYKATVPFGTFALHGEIGGTILFFSGTLEESEYYHVKYFDREELKSLTLMASTTSIVVDGEFLLEEVILTQTIHLFFLFPHKNTYHERWIIHIPYLPEINQTLTEDWTR